MSRFFAIFSEIALSINGAILIWYTHVAVSCGYDTCFAVKACDGLYHLTKSMDRIEIPIPSGFQSILWTFVRHTVSRCLIFPALPKVTRSRCQNEPINTLGFLQFLPSGQYGLCFGYFFSGLLPLRSHLDSPPFRVCFWESLVIRLHLEFDQIYLLTWILLVGITNHRPLP